jgi:hypothetical protein
VLKLASPLVALLILFASPVLAKNSTKTPPKTEKVACITVEQFTKMNEGEQMFGITGDALKLFVANANGNLTEKSIAIPETDNAMIIVRENVAVFFPFNKGCATGTYGVFPAAALPLLLKPPSVGEKL